MMPNNFNLYLQKNAQIDQEQIELLSKNLKLDKVKKNAFLLKPGEICAHSFFVEKGLLRAYAIDNEGKEHIIMFGCENWIVSDRSSAYFNEPSEFYIDAIEETTVVYIDRDFIESVSAISTFFRQSNNSALHNHIRHLQKRVNLLLSATAEQRYLDFINLYPNITPRVPQWMIASYLGITPESLSRVRKELVNKQLKAT